MEAYRCCKKHRKVHKPKWMIILFPLAGLTALIWVLIRVVPKPSRAAYPCQKAAIPIAWIFVGWILGAICGIIGKWIGFKKLLSGRLFIGVFIVVIILLSVPAYLHFNKKTAVVEIDELPNHPIGTAKGVHPGRVVWVHDPDATDWDYQPPRQPWDENGENTEAGFWWEDEHTDQAIVDAMMSKAIKALAGEPDEKAAWDALFRNTNKSLSRGDRGYEPGQKIAVKVNFCTANLVKYRSSRLTYDRSKADKNKVDTSPHAVKALLGQLVYAVGVKQSDIWLGDTTALVPESYMRVFGKEFPDVHYFDAAGEQGRVKAEFSDVPLKWSTPDANESKVDYIPECFVQADYVINFAMLKGHFAGITLCGKNHYGSLIRAPDCSVFGIGRVDEYYDLHDSLPCAWWTPGMGHYRAIVDLIAHKDLGGKTVLYLVDGLYSGYYAGGVPRRWKMPPFGDGQKGDWPSSLFVSQDPVAIDSVGYDFIREEWPRVATGGPADIGAMQGGEQDYLHEAALCPNSPSNTKYDPEGDGIAAESLGVHEHWNNPIDKQYSRNLGTGDGIELVKIISPDIAHYEEKEVGPDKGKVKVSAVSGASIKVWPTSDKDGEKAFMVRYVQNSKLIAPGSKLVELYSGRHFYEAPCWDNKTGKLYFAGWAQDRLQFLRLDEPGKAEVVIDDVDRKIGINGAFMSTDGRMLTAEVKAHRVASYEVTEAGLQNARTLAHDPQWKQPNDICQSPNGDIYFSDPHWGGDHSQSAVYLLSRSGEVKKVADDLSGPNGLIISCDEKTLYVADSIDRLWKSYAINADGSVGKGKVFYADSCEYDLSKGSDLPDGMTIDRQGNVYLTGLGGVRIVSPGGKLLWMICIDEKTTNVTLGGDDGRWLFITCDRKVYGLRMYFGLPK